MAEELPPVVASWFEAIEEMDRRRLEGPRSSHPVHQTEIRLVRLLDGLGDDAEEVADTLNKKGVQGRTSIPSQCAIAEYLRQEMKDYEPKVGSSYVRVERKNNLGALIRTPQHIKEFITKFDNDELPHLIKGVVPSLRSLAGEASE